MELCQNCHAGCCRRYNPHLWGSDIIRICKILKVDINFFTSAYKIDNEKAEQLKGKEPLFIFTDSGNQDYFLLTIKQNESKFFPSTSKCMFLQEWSAVAQNSEKLTGIISRCGIYDIRPVNCRTWPATYDETKQKIVIKDPYLVLSNQHKKLSDSQAYDLCERTLLPEDYSAYVEQYTQNTVLNRNEKEFFIQLSEKWNKNPDISDNFYEFLLWEYNNRIEHILE